MEVRDVMTKEVEMLAPDTKIAAAAKKMKELNTGSIPVSDGERIHGLLTDRDIVIRCIAESKDVNQCTAKEIMTSPIQYIFDDQNLEDAAERMKMKKVRRLIVLNRDKRLVGIVSLSDLAKRADDEVLPGKILKSVSAGAERSSQSTIQ